MFMLFFIPGLPKDMFVWLFSLSDEKPYKFLFLTTIARIPSIITSTWCGHELVEENYLLSVAIFSLSVLLAVLGGVVYGVIKKRNAAQEIAPESFETVELQTSEAQTPSEK
jgi:uncharacterized membrane protein YdjX (TVP38/TMEM64 family)